MITWGHLRRFVVGASAVVVLAGCQGSSHAAPTPTPVRPTEVISSAAPSASPSASGPASQDAAARARVPPAARAHTFAGAQAFAEFYLNRTNDAWSLPDWRVLAPLATSACKSCANYVETARSLEHDHQRYDGNSVSVRSAAWLPESTRAKAYVSVVAVQLATRIVDADGVTVERVPEQNGISEFELVWRHDRWYVNAIRLMENP